MMTRSCSALMVCVGLSALLPESLNAQAIPSPAARPCGQCASAAPLCTCTTFQPVVETRVRAEPSVTVHQQPRIGCRTAAEITHVPVTTFRNVMVDEGQYQMVWVPRPVTRQIAETSLQPQVTYRSEPFVYTEPVTQWSTRLVPEQTVRYVPRTQVVLGVPPAAPGSLAVAAPIQSRPTAARPAIAAGAGPIPDPAFAATTSNPADPSWTTISSRGPSGPAPWEASSRDPEYQVLPAEALVPGESVKAPSAAIVWQTPGTRRSGR